MKRPALLRVEHSPGTFASLFASSSVAGIRLGWLDLSLQAVQPVPEDLAAAADLGALRAVAVAEGRTVVIKPRRGPAVLEDLLREHFRGTTAVLVWGEVDAPRLTPATGGTWRVETENETLEGNTESLLAWLRLPSFRMMV